eukprot:574173-Pleurochrysis_carterae.AAC.6
MRPPILFGPLVAQVGAQPTPALLASDNCAAPKAAAVDAGTAVVLEVIAVLVGLEKQRLQLQHLRRAVGQEERGASLAQELLLLELVPRVLHAHQLQGADQCSASGTASMRSRSVAFAAHFARRAASWALLVFCCVKPAGVCYFSTVTLRSCRADE